PLSGTLLDLPDDIDPRDVSIDNPTTLVLNFEQVLSRSVPVRIAYKGKIPDDVMIMGSPVIIPARVVVRGASSIVSAIQFLTTEEIDIRGKRGKITEETGLTLEGRNITVSPQKILIEMEIRKRATRTLANIPPTLLQDDSEMSVEYMPKVVSLTIEGPEDVIREITADDVSVILNITTRSPGVYRLEPEVIVPAGIEKYFLDAEVFEITIFSGTREAGKDNRQNPATTDGKSDSTNR
ncbi:MAG TPA: CdaR family protein, partial [Candidatus Krumholzibacterium sp.]|nr:CdaR family protein [Candidatus Krumholzibacterium sp.]